MNLSVPENCVDAEAFDKLKKVLHEGTNINFECYRESYLKRRLNVRLAVTKTQTYSDYIQYLKENSSEYDLLVNDLTINYTKFFRDPDVFSFLESTVLPKLLSSRRWVRIWSAGCATGEEPYSLAILAHEVAKQQLNNYKVKIYASDLDRTALAKAKGGEYTCRMVQDINETLLSKYFECEDDNYKVKPFVKQLVQFEEQDLMTTPRHQNLDLILCRNVMIYFSKEIQQKIYINFWNSLRSGGYLVTGKTEFVGAETSKKFASVDAKCRIYQKSA